MSIYQGARTDDGATVTVDGKPLDARHDLRNHSPDGFEWGYGGSGPAQLALAILAHHYGVAKRKKEPRIGDEPTLAERRYQDFKFGVIASLPRESWSLTTDQIDVWLREAVAP